MLVVSDKAGEMIKGFLKEKNVEGAIRIVVAGVG